MRVLPASTLFSRSSLRTLAGRSMTAHFSTCLLNPDGSFRDVVDLLNSSSDVSPTGSQMPRLVGLAYASRLYRELPELRGMMGPFSKNGDEVAFGTIGDAALGVLLRQDQNLARRWRLSDAMSAHLKQRYLLPEPRNALAEAVLQNASAAMDVSDGLAGDLAKLCRASGVAAEIDVARVPHSDAVRAAVAADPAMMETALSGGDDYEIVLTLAADKLAAFRAAAQAAGVSATEIGRIATGEGARFLHRGKALSFAQPSYSHF